jgi:hypothetical protein
MSGFSPIDEASASLTECFVNKPGDSVLMRPATGLLKMNKPGTVQEAEELLTIMTDALLKQRRER